MSALLIIIKVLIVWTIASFIGGAILCYFIRVAKREQANHLPPLPESSILGNRPKRVS
jgi:hypothetical protein